MTDTGEGVGCPDMFGREGRDELREREDIREERLSSDSRAGLNK